MNVLVRKERVPATLAEIVGVLRQRDRDAQVAVHKGPEGRGDRGLSARLVASRLPVDEVVLVQRRGASGEVHDGRHVGVKLDRLGTLNVRVRGERE